MIYGLNCSHLTGRPYIEREEDPAVDQFPIRREHGVLLQGQQQHLLRDAFRVGGWAVHSDQASSQARREPRPLLRSPGGSRTRVPPLLGARPQGHQAREHTRRRKRLPQAHRLWILQSDPRPNVDPLRHPRIPRPRDHSLQVTIITHSGGFTIQFFVHP